MLTKNCIYCDKVCENMKGMLYIDVPMPDGCLFPMIMDFRDKLSPVMISVPVDSGFIYRVTQRMELYVEPSLSSKDPIEVVEVLPDKFTHLRLEYDYFYFNNHPRVKKARLKVVEHITNLYEK